MENIIEIKNLKKYYKDVKAVDDISFNIEKGALFAFLGLNGAGKSTTINILCTLLAKDSGEVIIDGHNLDNEDFEIKKDIGIVFQSTVLDDKLTVKENLTTRASFYGLKGKAWEDRLQELSNILSLEDIMTRPFGKLSGGQRRRVDIARGLINSPKILFLDEPTTGLDPKTRRMIWKNINKIQEKQNMTVFLTTHYMEEAEYASNVVIIDDGKIVANDSPHNLKKIYSGDYVKLYDEKNDEIDNLLTLEKYNYKYENESYLIKMNSSKEAIDFLNKHTSIIKDFEVVKGNMDDVFLNATGKKLEA